MYRKLYLESKTLPKQKEGECLISSPRERANNIIKLGKERCKFWLIRHFDEGEITPPFFVYLNTV